MAGNSRRKGAVVKPGVKKGATVGSGGRGKRALQGRGPTPKAEERAGHPAARRATAAGKRASSGSPRAGARSAPGRGASGRREGAEVVAGRNPVVEALRAGVPATTLWMAERIDADERVREAVRLANARHVVILEAPRPELDRIAAGAVHQGLALGVPAYDYAVPVDIVRRAQGAGQLPLLVALDGVTDPRNLGAVVRSVAAFGGHGVVVPERRSAGVTASAWKASAGALSRVPVARATNLTRSLTDLQQAGLFVVGLDAAGALPVADLEAADGPLCLVVGSEGKGLSRLVRETCDLVVSIPILEATESLNAGVAAGIALYEVARHRSSR